MKNGLVVVVGAPDEFCAMRVASLIVLRRVEIHVVDPPANRTNPPSSQPLQQRAGIHLDVQNQRPAAPLFAEKCIQELRLADRSGETVQNEPGSAIWAGDSLGSDGGNHLV